LLRVSKPNLLQLSINNYPIYRVYFFLYLAFKDKTCIFKSDNKASELIRIGGDYSGSNIIISTVIKWKANLLKNSKSRRIRDICYVK
jgi:hypothetical protein